MKNIDLRIKKLETRLITGDETAEYERMMPEERRHRIAELVYKGLDNPAMTEMEFISVYLELGPEERAVLCGYDSNEDAETRLLADLKARINKAGRTPV